MSKEKPAPVPRCNYCGNIALRCVCNDKNLNK